MAGTSGEIRVSGKTLDQALQEAARQLNVAPGQISHRIISQTRGGFLAFFGRKVEIMASKKQRSDEGASSRPRKARAREDALEARAETNTEVSVPAVDAPPLEPHELDALVEDLRTFCKGITTRMYGADVEVSAQLADDRLILNVESDDLAVQLAKNMKISESLEHVLRKKPRHLKRELPFRIFVDVNGVRRQREEELVEMAKDLSAKVNENKRPIVLNYKSSYDRKIIHMALDKDDRVYTKSIGSGANRKLMILPFKGGEDNADQ